MSSRTLFLISVVCALILSASVRAEPCSGVEATTTYSVSSTVGWCWPEITGATHYNVEVEDIDERGNLEPAAWCDTTVRNRYSFLGLRHHRYRARYFVVERSKSVWTHWAYVLADMDEDSDKRFGPSDFIYMRMELLLGHIDLGDVRDFTYIYGRNPLAVDGIYKAPRRKAKAWEAE